MSYLTYFAVTIMRRDDAELAKLASKLVPEVFETVLYLTVMVIGWYFAVRPRSDRRS